MATTAQNPDESWMTRYLLGQLAGRELEQAEERLFSEDEALHRLEIVRDELIDDYLTGELGAQDEESFERYFLAVPARRRRVDLARAFWAAVEKEALVEAPATRREPAEPTSRRARARWIPPARAGRWLLAAAVVAAMLGGSWSLARLAQLRDQVRELQAERQALRQRAEERQDTIDTLRRRQASLAEELAEERKRRELAPRREPRALRTAKWLLAAGTRGQGPARRRLAPGVEWIELQIDAAGLGEHATLAAVLVRRPEGEEVWSERLPPPAATAWGPLITVAMPAAALSSGDYRLTLLGMTSQGAREEIDDYEFRLVRE